MPRKQRFKPSRKPKPPIYEEAQPAIDQVPTKHADDPQPGVRDAERREVRSDELDRQRDG